MGESNCVRTMAAKSR
uniref:Uncharacterized protein n=1 Tax=Arundo donax TaxID=35708 RepID=A0A0A9ESC8_ARUDO